MDLLLGGHDKALAIGTAVQGTMDAVTEGRS